jgi:hypothetical protein
VLTSQNAGGAAKPRHMLEFLVLIPLLAMAGCSAGKGSGGTSNSVSVTITSKITSLTAGAAAVAFNATVQNGSSGVTWTLTANGTSCSPTCGSLSGASGTSVTYTPPASVPSAPNNQPTITAKSVDDTTKSDSNSFTIGSSAVVVSISNKFTSVTTGASGIVVNAAVQNDSTNSGVTWTLTAGGAACSPACGSLSGATATSVTYTPPASLPTNTQATLTATSARDGSKSDSDNFTITPAIVVTITNKFASVKTGTNAFVVNATVQNDPTNSGVTWTLTAGGSSCSPACGSLSGATVTSVTYTPPSSLPGNTQATLTATSVRDGSRSDSDAFTISKPPISVVIQNKVSSVIAGSSSIFFSANVQNDPSNGGTNWTLTVNGIDCQSTCGTLSPAGPQAVVYNPPASVPTTPNNRPTLSAISITDSTKSDSDIFTITAPPPVSVTVTQVGSVLAGSSGVNFSANVQNDFNSPPKGVTWALTAGGSPCAGCGSLTNSTATSVTYIPPASVPSSPNNQPTLTATSVADASKSGADTFTITSTVANNCGTSGGNESLLLGHYALLMEGFTGGGTGTPILRAASFVANGSGGITSGEEDINDTISPQHVSFTSGGSLYTVGSDHRGCLQLANAGGTTTIFRFALGRIISGVASKGSIIEFDDNSGNGRGSRGSGILRLQDPSSFVLSALQNQYAFGVDGWTPGDNQLVRFSAAGSFSGNLSSGVDDLNFGGITSPDFTVASGSINAISPTSGRTSGSFDIFDWAIYIVNSSEFFVIGTDPVSPLPVSVGRAIATGSSFTASSLSGKYVARTSGNSNGSASVDLELLAMTPGGAQTGTLAGTVNSYGGGNGAQTTTLSGVTYNVDSASGRTTLGNPSDNLPVLYLTTPTDGISAFLVGVGADAEMGFADSQPSQTYSTASVAGTYFFGTEAPGDNSVNNKAEAATIAGNGSMSGKMDVSGATATLQTGAALNVNVSINPDGTGTVGASTVAITNGAKIFYIDETAGVVLVGEQ